MLYRYAAMALLMLVCSLEAEACWRQHPEKREVMLREGAYKAVVVPRGDWGRGEVGPHLTLYAKVGQGWQRRQQIALVNTIAPSSLAISPDGKTLVTYGNWGGAERGNDVFVIYQQGKVVRQCTVAQVIGPGRDLETRKQAARVAEMEAIAKQIEPHLERFRAEEKVRQEKALKRSLTEDEIEELSLTIELCPTLGVVNILDEKAFKASSLYKIKPLLDRYEALSHGRSMGRSRSTAGNNWLRGARAFFLNDQTFVFWLEREELWSAYALGDGRLLPITQDLEEQLVRALLAIVRTVIEEESRPQDIHLLGRFGGKDDVPFLKTLLERPVNCSISRGPDRWDPRREAIESTLAVLEKAPHPGDVIASKNYRYHGSVLISFAAPDEFEKGCRRGPVVTLVADDGDLTKHYISYVEDLYRGEKTMPVTVQVGIHTLRPGTYEATLNWNGKKHHRSPQALRFEVRAGMVTRHRAELISSER